MPLRQVQGRSLGLVVAVSSTLPFCHVVIEGSDKVNCLVRLSSLKREDVVFPARPQPYYTAVERVNYNTWDEVHGLITTTPVELSVAA